MTGSGGPPYVDYQVARLWEDILNLLPYALEPVPSDIAAHLEDLECREGLSQRVTLEQAGLESLSDEDAEWHSFGWWNARELDRAYLVKAPSAHFWRTGGEVHASWASDPDGDTLWAPTHGVCTLSVQAFLDEVRAFDRAFLASMEERVRTLAVTEQAAGASIDLAQLQHEQQERSTWLPATLSHLERARRTTNWASVRKSLSRSARDRSSACSTASRARARSYCALILLRRL